MWTTITIILASLIVGTIIGFLVHLAGVIEKWIKFSVKDAEYIAQNTEKIEKRAIVKSEVFKNRLKEIIEKIKERAKEEHTSLRITSLESCKTDNQIRVTLRERGFRIERMGDNSLTIYW